MHGRATAWTGFILWFNDDFFSRQMGRQCAAIDRARLFARRFQRRRRTLILGLRFRQRLLGLLHAKVELIRIELFRFAPELREGLP